MYQGPWQMKKKKNSFGMLLKYSVGGNIFTYLKITWVKEKCKSLYNTFYSLYIKVLAT